MSSLYAQYVLEREGLETLENEKGFLTYKIENDYLFISDIFVTESARKENIATKMADEIVEKAVKLGIKYMYSHVDTRAKNWKESVKFIKKYGCIPIKLENTLIYFQKEIG